MEKIFSGMDTVGVPWQAVSAFLRFMTNRRLPGPKLSLEAASQIVTEWLGQPSVRLLSPGDGHWSILRRMLIEGQAPGALVSDAVIAALTVEHGGTLYSADRDFARFPGLRWVNPLE
jgi:toxin-antitoxin system PIN domain toxin